MSTQIKTSIPEDGPTPVELRKLRKRTQNRLNQRAHRRRLEAIKPDSSPDRYPFRVDRWRIDRPDSCEGSQTSKDAAFAEVITNGTRTDPIIPLDRSRSSGKSEMAASGSATSSYCPTNSLYADLLLHLIYQNVFRAFVLNADVLDLMTAIARPRPLPNPPVIYRSDFRCSLVATIHQVDAGIPNSLSPTPLQASDTHSFWINVIPFARLRDNLIRWEAYFDHKDFLRDILGSQLVDGPPPGESRADKTSASRLHTGENDAKDEDDDEVTTGRRGFIVWGEPHDKRNWEATPGFLSKWAWAVEGCEELVEFSNDWRLSRGEEPVSISSTGDVSMIRASDIPLVVDVEK